MTVLDMTFDLQHVNAMSREDFVAAFGSAFEHAAWVADEAWASRPFVSVEDLHAAMFAVVQRAPAERQLAFLRGHPELAGREAQAGTMTNESVSEQASAGLNALSRAEIDELSRLNAQYLERHGFPFIVAVRRSTKAQIFEQLHQRIAAGTEAERHAALAQIGIITGLRVAALVRG